MRDQKADFEQFIAHRFLDFYNEKESTNFKIKEKADETEREKPIYDIYAGDDNSKKEMAIEIKRLLPKEKTHVQNIKDWINTYVNMPLKGKIKGDFSLLIKGFESPFKSDKTQRKELLTKIREEIQAIKDPEGYYRLKCSKGMALVRWNRDGSSITAWPVDFSSADDKEIVRILDASLQKFESEEMINNILLVELSSFARTTELASIIEQLKHGFEPGKFDAEPRNFDLIDGIYHIGIHHDTVIARAHPKGKIFETGFFKPSDFMEVSDFREWTYENLL